MQQTTLTISTSGQGLYEFTDKVQNFVADQAIDIGLCTVFVQHTSCSLIIQENADREVQMDMKNFFARLVPPTSDPSMAYIQHTYEGSDDMPAHIKATLTQTSISIPVNSGRLMLGTWQGIYLFEHRDRTHTRKVVLHLQT